MKTSHWPATHSNNSPQNMAIFSSWACLSLTCHLQSLLMRAFGHSSSLSSLLSRKALVRRSCNSNYGSASKSLSSHLAYCGSYFISEYLAHVFSTMPSLRALLSLTDSTTLDLSSARPNQTDHLDQTNSTQCNLYCTS